MVICKLSVDKLMKNNVPYLNFIDFCTMKTWLEVRDGYYGRAIYPTIALAWLKESENEEWNAIVEEMLDRFGVPWAYKLVWIGEETDN